MAILVGMATAMKYFMMRHGQAVKALISIRVLLVRDSRGNKKFTRKWHIRAHNKWHSVKTEYSEGICYYFDDTRDIWPEWNPCDTWLDWELM